MKCKCGNKTKLVEFQTFSYNYCETCKVEVSPSDASLTKGATAQESQEKISTQSILEARKKWHETGLESDKENYKKLLYPDLKVAWKNFRSKV